MDAFNTQLRAFIGNAVIEHMMVAARCDGLTAELARATTELARVTAELAKLKTQAGAERLTTEAPTAELVDH